MEWAIWSKCIIDYVLTEKRESPWCQLCRHLRHHKLSKRHVNLRCRLWRQRWYHGNSKFLVYDLIIAKWRAINGRPGPLQLRFIMKSQWESLHGWIVIPWNDICHLWPNQSWIGLLKDARVYVMKLVSIYLTSHWGQWQMFRWSCVLKHP